MFYHYTINHFWSISQKSMKISCNFNISLKGKIELSDWMIWELIEQNWKLFFEKERGGKGKRGEKNKTKKIRVQKKRFPHAASSNADSHEAEVQSI